MWTAILAAVLSTLGVAVAGGAVTDVLNSLGTKAASKVRSYANDLYAVITKNNQTLSDFKNASESQKANIINSLANSSGLGNRAESLRQDLAKVQTADVNMTKEVAAKNKAAQAEYNKANELTDASKTGLIGMGQALTSKTQDTSNYEVSPQQNINGGLSTSSTTAIS